MASRGSIAARAVLAVTLLVLFYVVAISIALGLFAAGVFAAKHARGSGAGKAIAFCFITGGVILWSIFPRLDRFTAPGPRLESARHPRLFQMLRDIAAALRQPMPEEVYLVPDVNAFVTQRGGLMGIGGRRVVGVGLPLLRALTVTEMRGVLAHEFGHFVGGDTKLGPWIYKTRAALLRTIGNLGDGVMGWLFLQYFKLFLRITEAVSRAQEYEADSVAARLVGARSMVAGLKRTHAAAPAFNVFMDSEYLPVLDAGFRPPLADGFGRFLGSKLVATALEKELTEAMGSRQRDPYDSHPPLPDRIAALEKLPPGEEPPANEAHALSLLDDVPAIEKALLDMVLQGPTKKLETLDWSETAEKVTLPGWKKLLSEHGAHLRGTVAGQLGADAKVFAKLGRSMFGAADVPPESHRRAGVSLVGSALGVALVARGFSVHEGIGEPTAVVKGDFALPLFKKLGELAEGQLAADEWRKLCEQLEVADLDLGTVASSKKG